MRFIELINLVTKCFSLLVFIQLFTASAHC